MYVRVFVCALSGVRQGAVAVGLVYVVGGLKVRGERGGAWARSGASESPTPFSHLTYGSGDEGVKSQSESVFPSFSFAYTRMNIQYSVAFRYKQTFVHPSTLLSCSM